MLKKLLTVYADKGLLKTASMAANYLGLLILRNAFGCRYRERRIRSFRMLLDLQDTGICQELMINENREEEHIYILRHELKEGMTVLDIGANIGYYSCVIGKMIGERGKIYAVEPSVDNFYLLNLNIKLNKLNSIVETFNIGIAGQTGVGRFYESEKSNWHTFYPKVHHGRSESLIKKSAIDVQVMTVGDFIRGKRRIDLIRMDIEGYEVEVFKGLVLDLQDRDLRPKILFETHRPRYDDMEHSMRDALKGLFENGYSVKFLVSAGHRLGAYKAFKKRGYAEENMVAYLPNSDESIYERIVNEDGIELICDTMFTKAALLVREV